MKTLAAAAALTAVALLAGCGSADTELPPELAVPSDAVPPANDPATSDTMPGVTPPEAAADETAPEKETAPEVEPPPPEPKTAQATPSESRPPESPAGPEPPVELASFSAETAAPPPQFAAEGDAGAVRVSFDDFDLLKIMNLDPVPADVELPKWLASMDGRRVRVRGFMYPTFTATGLTGFVLARDNEICCFGRNPKIYDLVPVELGPGETTDYIEGRPFDVEGVFHVEPEADADELWQLFYMTDAKVLR